LTRAGALLGTSLVCTLLACGSAWCAGFGDMRQTALSAKDGAPASAYAFAQTPDGFLWVGTATGLYRYDGASFSQPWAGHLSGVAIVSLLAEANGDLWIGYIFGGIDRVHAGRVISYPVAELPGGSVVQFLRAPDGTLWVACSMGIARFDGERWVTVGPAMGYSSEKPQWLGSSQGKVIVVTPTAGFQLAPGSSRFEQIDRLTARQMRWGAPPHPQWRPEELETLEDSDPDNSEEILDHTGALWTSKGLVVRRFMWPAGAGQPVVAEAALDEEVAGEVLAIFEDREGNVWVGTGSGLERFSPSKLHRLHTVRSNGRLPLVIPKNATTLWISGYDIPLQALDGTPVSSPAVGHRITTYTRASDGSLWVAGDLGVLHYTLKGVVEKTPALPLGEELKSVAASLPWESIAEDRAGLIWLAVVGHGQFCLKDGAWSAPDPGLELPTRTAIRLLSDDRKRLWLSYPDNKVAVVSDGRSRIYTAADGLRVGNVTSLAVRGEHVWLGGDLGVAALVNGRFVSLRGRPDGSFRATAGIIETASGELWLNAAAGLVRIPRDSTARFLSGDSAPVDFELFDWHDGLEGGAPMLRPSPNLSQMPDGRIWLSRMNGVWWIDPDHIVRNRVPPLVSVERVVRDGEHLRIDYTAASLTSPERVHFRYRLAGMNESWPDAGSRRQAYYTNLAPGRYTFMVMAANEDGVWTDKIVTAAFTILPAFYQTPWFAACCIAAGLAAFYLIYLLWRRHLAREFNLTLDARVSERTRIARDLHDTLLQSFHGLLLQCLAVYKLLPRSEAQQRLGAAVELAFEAINEGRDAVEGLRTSTVDGNDLAAAINALGEELVGQGTEQSSVVLRTEVEGTPQTLRPLVRDDIYRIAGESLRNALRHAGATRIEVDLCYDVRQLRLRVRDDGKGIDPQVLREDGQAGHYGIRGMRERAKLMGGSLAVWTAKDSGTEIELIIPASRAYAASRAVERGWLVRKFFGARTPIES